MMLETIYIARHGMYDCVLRIEQISLSDYPIQARIPLELGDLSLVRLSNIES